MSAEVAPRRIGPQPGPQELLLRKRWVNLIVYGGGAGGGKTYGMLLDGGWHAFVEPVRGYNAVIFRRTNPQITAPGGMWETSQDIYPHTGAKPRQNPWLGWEWPQYGTSVRFHHLQHEEDKMAWQGAQVDFIGFDELTHFSEAQFFYLLSRSRSPAGTSPVLRATTNPDPESWVKRFLAPWVDDTHPDPAASGEVRYFYREADAIQWVKTPAERPPHIERDHLYSVTFIQSHLEDNPALLEKDPGYKGRLHALPLVERTILLGGPLAWSIRASGNKFKREWFTVLPPDSTHLARDYVRVVRAWDLAATEAKPGTDPDWTVGVKMGKRADGSFVILDVVRARLSPLGVEQLMRNTAILDGPHVAIAFEQEPGAAAKIFADRIIRLLAGYNVRAVRSTGDKELRANPFSAQVEAGHVSIVGASWAEAFLNELVGFPQAGLHDDQVDAAALAFTTVALGSPAPPASFHDSLRSPSPFGHLTGTAEGDDGSAGSAFGGALGRGMHRPTFGR